MHKKAFIIHTKYSAIATHQKQHCFLIKDASHLLHAQWAHVKIWKYENIDSRQNPIDFEFLLEMSTLL